VIGQVSLRATAVAATLVASLAVPGAQQLTPTRHPPLPDDLNSLWFAPQSAAPGDLAAAATFIKNADFDQAVALLADPGAGQGTLAPYARYLDGLAYLGLQEPQPARDAFQAALAAHPVGFLAQAAAVGEADADDALGDPQAALAIYERLASEALINPDAVLLRLADIAVEVGNEARANAAYQTIIYQYPLSDAADTAAAALAVLPMDPPLVAGGARYRLERDRAEQLFAAHRYDVARTAFDRLRKLAKGAEREHFELRIAEADYYMRQFRTARNLLKPHTGKGSQRAEALYYWALAVRELKATETAERTLRRIADDYATSPWAEQSLNELATWYIVDDRDEQADAVFRELLRKFPSGRFAQRAGWRTGWWAYTHGQYGATIDIFERSAEAFPRSDYRPAWLYWSGRAHDALGDAHLAQARYSLTVTDYRNSYYGRLASDRLTGPPPRRRLVTDVTPPGFAPPAPPPNERVIHDLLEAGLFDQAVNEIRYAERVWGGSPALDATLAWALNARGDLRPAINAMKRAYPQYLADGGQDLPDAILHILFPVDYWPLIQRYAAERHLDPYLLAALVAQESNFSADVRSAANAYGLMQLLPATARRYAPKVGLRYSRTLLTSPDTNMRLGTAYFADLVRQFGDVHLALAAYNAGEQRVAEWVRERPGMERDEFIDDIPFPETQNYVKRILGTAADYRRLYGSGEPADAQH
jgi:peptidoglycan lytic transglycosylase